MDRHVELLYKYTLSRKETLLNPEYDKSIGRRRYSTMMYGNFTNKDMHAFLTKHSEDYRSGNG